jgi:intracellular multiplication protein IcmV
MGFFRGIGKAFKPAVNVTAWLDTTRISETASYIAGFAKRTFTPVKPTTTETFAQAMTRFGLTEADIAQRKIEFRRLLWVSLFIFICIAGYAIYLFFQTYVRAGLICSLVSLIALVQAIRYHFWLFQIKKRKLGCTLKEWFKQGILGQSA